ncbi:MAG TPA: hypothetical protein VLF91_04580 [Candidatus Saccharimonadales bacterium]|nr:hypothetical protein [Candidatus Saccharimonadales bacterium]
MKDIYTPAGAALEIMQERRSQTSIKDEVARYLGGALPADCLDRKEPVAMLARYVARATEEDRVFAEAAQQAGFVPYWSTYWGDRFTTRNPEKVETIRPPIRWQKGQKTRSWVVEPAKRDGGIGELETLYRCSSSEYQQAIREIVFANDGSPELVANEFDMGDWYKAQAPRFGYASGNLAPYYYPATMALATAFCVLYEDFDGGPNASSGDLAAFRNQVVYPAFERVEQELGIKPLVVRLPFAERMNETDLSLLDQDQAEQFRTYGPRAVQFGKVGEV